MLRFLFLVVSPFLMAHPLHVSVCEIEYDRESAALEIIQRIFIDDLELEIRRDRNEPTLDLFEPPNDLTTDQLINDYLKTKLSFEVNDEPVTFHYLGHEIEGPALVSYIEIENVKSLKSIKAKNEILTNFYEDQINIVHITVGGHTRSLKLEPGKTYGEVRY